MSWLGECGFLAYAIVFNSWLTVMLLGGAMNATEALIFSLMLVATGVCWASDVMFKLIRRADAVLLALRDLQACLSVQESPEKQEVGP